MKKSFKEYKVEILIVLLVLLGIFLLVERIELQSLTANGIEVLQTTLKRLDILLKTGVKFYILSLSPSDFIGWVLLILAIVIVVWLIRHRFTNSTTIQAAACPRCGSPLHRVHRKYFDRLLSQTFLPHARRYRCANSSCRWTGLRRPRHRLHRINGSDSTTSTSGKNW